jgi:hypothetical protein
MRYYRFIPFLFAILPFIISNSVNAITDDSWRILVFDRRSNSILDVTSQGITNTWELPESVQEIKLSPRERFAAISFYDAYYDEQLPDYSTEIRLYDLENRECCRSLVTQEMFTAIFDGNNGRFRIGGFNEDGTLLAVNYLYYDAAAEFLPPYKGLAVIGVETGKLIAKQATGELFAGWFGADVAIYPSVQPPPGASPQKYRESNLQFWNPLTSEITVSDYRVASLPYTDLHDDIGEFLVTGERIVASFLPDQGQPPLDYPYVLYSNSEATTSFPIWVEIQSIQNEFIDKPRDRISRWITDGKYIYNRVGAYNPGAYQEEVQILSRSGEIQSLEIPANDFFLTGTPDGWLALRLVSDYPILMHYIYENGVTQSEEILSFEGNMILLKGPLLGISLGNPPPFPEVQQPHGMG